MILEKFKNMLRLLTLIDMLFIHELQKRFKCLIQGSKDAKISKLIDLTLLLDPPFIFSNFSKRFTNKEKLKFWEAKSKSYYNLKKPIDYYVSIEENFYEYEDLIKIKDTIINFLDLSEKKFANNSSYNFFKVYNNFEIINCINQKNITAFPKQILAMDTFKISENFFVTIILDHASLKVLRAIFTPNLPTSQQLIFLVESYFVPKYLKRARIFHCDMSGSNMSNEFISYFIDKKNVQLSFTKKAMNNQLVENANKCIKDIIKMSHYQKFKAFNFEDLEHDYKVGLALFGILKYNQNKNTNKRSSHLHGYSREFVDPDFVNANTIKASSISTEGIILTHCIRLYLKRYSFFQKQEYYNENLDNVEDYLNIITINDLTEIIFGYEEKTEKSLILLKRKINNEKDMINLICSTKNKSLQKNSKPISEKEIINRLNSILYSKYNKAKTLEERLDIEYQIGLLKLGEIRARKQKRDQNRIFRLFSAKNAELSQFKIGLDYFLQKTGNTINYNINESYIPTTKFKVFKVVFPEFFTSIVDNIRLNSLNKSYASKYIVANLMLKLFPIKVSCLMFFTFQQLKDLYDKKGVFIRTKAGTTSFYPYVESMKYFLDYTREDYLHLVSTHDKKYLESEVQTASSLYIWGNITLKSLTSQLNKLLKFYSKELTNESYRKGFLLLIILTIKDPKTKKDFLEAISSYSTEIESSSLNSKRELILEHVHSIKEGSKLLESITGEQAKI